MAAVTIRNLSEEAHRALKIRAARHNRSTEAEMRAILEAAPSRRARPVRAFPRPTAISPRSPPRTGSPWHRATRVHSMPRV